MRDAFGGVFMMRLMLVFIVVYVAFTAISYKYAKSFRIKNSVIDLIEQNQVIDLGNFLSDGAGNNIAKLDNIIDSADYDIECNSVVGAQYLSGNEIKHEGNTIGYCYRGIIITNNYEKSNNTDTKYYNVYTYVDWNIGAMNMILALSGRDQNSENTISGRWRISGEAVVAY